MLVRRSCVLGDPQRMTLFTFAKLNADDKNDIVSSVELVGWLLEGKYEGCSARIVSTDKAHDTVTVDLCIHPSIDSVSCMEWYTEELARRSLVLVRDEHLQRALRIIRKNFPPPR